MFSGDKAAPSVTCYRKATSPLLEHNKATQQQRIQPNGTTTTMQPPSKEVQHKSSQSATHHGQKSVQYPPRNFATKGNIDSATTYSINCLRTGQGKASSLARDASANAQNLAAPDPLICRVALSCLFSKVRAGPKYKDPTQDDKLPCAKNTSHESIYAPPTMLQATRLPLRPCAHNPETRVRKATATAGTERQPIQLGITSALVNLRPQRKLQQLPPTTSTNLPPAISQASISPARQSMLTPTDIQAQRTTRGSPRWPIPSR